MGDTTGSTPFSTGTLRERRRRADAFNRPDVLRNAQRTSNVVKQEDAEQVTRGVVDRRK